MKIYLAGPLFSAAERDFNRHLSERLAMFGHEVWVPQEQVDEDSTPREIFDKDIDGLLWSNVIVANMDGADPDSGTCWECGWAYTKIPIVLFRTDFRRVSEPGAPFNIMLCQSADVVLNKPFYTVEQIAKEIHNALGAFA